MSTGKNSPATKEEKITVSAAEMHGSFQSKLTATASPFIQRESQQSNMQSLGDSDLKRMVETAVRNRDVALLAAHCKMLSGRPGLASLQKNIQVHLERLQAEDLGIPLSSDIRGRAAKDEEPPRQLSNSLEGFPNCFLSSSVNLPASGIGQTDTPHSVALTLVPEVLEYLNAKNNDKSRLQDILQKSGCRM
ncbi:hypothetical protein Naga_100760g2 [Nannochloropsis gaditana]|uniref:Uncharacterized protein n=1 Tax=Nannochloropsis gaditana TaxID=72520 RepID=W7T1Q6_9STRA|nr:hypothetical protein Naga_100760g2 [Nannochloropsis gaditana]